MNKTTSTSSILRAQTNTEFVKTNNKIKNKDLYYLQITYIQMLSENSEW